MKCFLLVLTLFYLNSVHAQDTLKEVFTPMYSRYYVLYGNNQFEYYFHHCTGTDYGKGTVKKGWFSWKFHFDSITPPTIQYACISGKKSDSLKISFRNAKDSTPDFWFNASINQIKNQWVDTNGITIPKSTGNSYSFAFNNSENDFLICNLSSNCGELIVYMPNTSWTYHSPGLEKLKKRGADFYTTEVVWDENEDDPYGKKGKRKIKAIYHFK